MSLVLRRWLRSRAPPPIYLSLSIIAVLVELMLWQSRRWDFESMGVASDILGYTVSKQTAGLLDFIAFGPPPHPVFCNLS